MTKALSEKIVVITGVGGGIGNTFLHHLKDKCKSIISSSRSSLAEVLGDHDSVEHHEHISLDLTSEQNVKKLFENIRNNYGTLDVFINTIGGSLYSHRLEDFPLEEFKEVLDVNLTSAFLLTKEAIHLMKEGGGNIVHIVSSSAKRVSKHKAPYGIAKAGLTRMIHYAASECGEYDIKINGISPTYVFTSRHERELEKKAKILQKTREEIQEHVIESQLLKKPLYPQDLLSLLELLLSTDIITGQIYHCTLGEVLSY
ncbi:MAG: SDR family oxidoreductase [Candidatus Korarchaeota archaeon]|nr:SDR family oxidoreductase [Candidatus Korarchaeota archaeon]NIU82226.1 SDR family oxidoreductase [Candidatus Thorarchaeota archaeon]NIW12689.1 SDR family oxidoreductase [Candidatus Thorarchaeota archaeon]NIW50896.1 SDR family oxidoreductase [Candidatus Korarchaeota archaeon]